MGKSWKESHYKDDFFWEKKHKHKNKTSKKSNFQLTDNKYNSQELLYV